MGCSWGNRDFLVVASTRLCGKWGFGGLEVWLYPLINLGTDFLSCMDIRNLGISGSNFPFQSTYSGLVVAEDYPFTGAPERGRQCGLLQESVL